MLDSVQPDLFDGKVVFITGGGSGINLGIGKAFARLGADVAICGRTADRLAAGAAELAALGARVSTSVADVRNYEAVAEALAASESRLGPCDVLICGAAGNFVAPAETISANGFRAVVDIDLVGTFNATRAAFDQLRRTRGVALFVSGGQATAPYAHQAHVGAAKAGVDALMRNLAVEWGSHGIRCNVIVPGPVEDTEGMKRLAGATSHEAWQSMVPLGRFGRAEEIGAMAAILCSPLASYVTGAVIPVDGGLALSGPGLFNRALKEAARSPS